MNNDEFDRLLSDLEVRLERLRALYEQYFIGIEKLEPTVPRKDVDRRFWDLRKVRVRNTALRFRLQTLVQRYNTLQQYWLRICRQIEAGTYSRHLRRAARIASQPPAAPTAPGVVAIPDPEGHGARTPAQTSAPAASSALDAARVAAIHQEFSRARRDHQQGGVSVEAVEARLRAAEAQLRARYPGKSIDFRVEVKDGKAVIKPFLR